MLILFSLLLLRHDAISQKKLNCKSLCKLLGNFGKVGGCHCSYIIFQKRDGNDPCNCDTNPQDSACCGNQVSLFLKRIPEESANRFSSYCNCKYRKQDPHCCPSMPMLPNRKYYQEYKVYQSNDVEKRCTCNTNKIEPCCLLANEYNMFDVGGKRAFWTRDN